MYELNRVAIWLAVLTSVSAQVDRTIEERGQGAEVVQAVVDRIRDACIYPDDHLILRRLAFVESRDGQDPRAFRHGYYGGIWQVKIDPVSWLYAIIILYNSS